MEAKPREFWKTEDYFKKVVYPKPHPPLFEEGNLEEAVNAEKCGYLGIKVLPDLGPPLEASLPWADRSYC